MINRTQFWLCLASSLIALIFICYFAGVTPEEMRSLSKGIDFQSTPPSLLFVVLVLKTTFFLTCYFRLRHLELPVILAIGALLPFVDWIILGICGFRAGTAEPATIRLQRSPATRSAPVRAAPKQPEHARQYAQQSSGNDKRLFGGQRPARPLLR